MKLFTPFRAWVHQTWVQNCEERMMYDGGPKLNVSEYFNQFKWWLRREYRFQKEKHVREQSRRSL